MPYETMAGYSGDRISYTPTYRDETRKHAARRRSDLLREKDGNNPKYRVAVTIFPSGKSCSQTQPSPVN